MTKRESYLKKEANRRFSIGDNFYPVNRNTGNIITDTIYKIERNLNFSNYYEEEDILCNGGNIYAKGTWAINLTKQKENKESNYSII
jgi:hypothetical protein